MNIDLEFYWKLFWRRLPVMSAFIIACAGLGVITALKLPDTYSTSARLLVESAVINTDQRDTVNQPDAVEQLDIIQQKLLTRANLIDIAQRFEVLENIRGMEPDRIVEHMLEATRIRRSAGRDQATFMTISFTGRSAQIVADVVNEYVTLVLDENADFRNSRASGTLDFFEEEVSRLSRDLDEKSTEIAVFKSENAEALPEDQSFRLQRQSQLQEQIARSERELASLTARRDEFVRVFEQTGRISQTAGGAPQTAEQVQLVTAQAELELLRSTYSDENPRVQRLIKRVERLEAIVAAQSDVVAGGSGTGEQISAERALLEATLADIDNRLKFEEAEMKRTADELSQMQAAISRSSANGIELAKLERDYSIIQSRYNAAVANLNSARMTSRIESTARGERIATIENASVPNVPAGPNRPKIALAGAAAGIMLAAGYFMLLEMLNRSVRRPAELISRFNVTPITTIPYMESRTRRFARRTGLIMATLTVLIGVPVILYLIDTYYLPLEVVVQRGLQQLGLG